MDLRIIVFILAASVVAYAYILYPVALLILRAIRPQSSGAESGPQALPSLTVTLSAYNAASTIGPVLEALLATEYPPRLRQILVVSDGSTDGTDDLVRAFAPRGVQLLRVEGRLGKTECENHALARLQGEIIVNTDASVILHPASLQRLVLAMADPDVGVASGRDVSVAWASNAQRSGESSYVGYEMWVRALESQTGGIVGASGCLYAVRAELHERVLPGALSRDFASVLWARMHGLRAVSVHDAFCYVPGAAGRQVEYRRKIRTMSRGLQTLFAHRQLLIPLHYGVFAWKLWSHKLLRWLAPIAIVVAAIALVTLGLGVLVLSGLIIGILGWAWPEHRPAPRILLRAGYLVASIWAGLMAWKQALVGGAVPVWEPTPRAVTLSPGPPASV